MTPEAMRLAIRRRLGLEVHLEDIVLSMAHPRCKQILEVPVKLVTGESPRPLLKLLLKNLSVVRIQKLIKLDNCLIFHLITNRKTKMYVKHVVTTVVMAQNVNNILKLKKTIQKKKSRLMSRMDKNLLSTSSD